MTSQPAGRGVARLVADFGHQIPTLAPPLPIPRDVGVMDSVVARRGHRRRGTGWAAVPAPMSVWRMTSEQVGGTWPLIAADGLPPTGALIGIDWLSGGAFYADPIGWTLAGTPGVTNPNVMIFGAPGQG